MSQWGPVYDQAARKWEEEPEYDDDRWEDYDGYWPDPDDEKEPAKR